MTATHTPQSGASVEPHYYQIMPELRRSAVYVMASFLAIAITLFFAAPLLPQRGPADVVAQYTIFGGIGLAMIVPLRWCVRVDERGVARRLLVRWDVWSWEDFASGIIRKKHPYTFVDPRRPWRRRTLRLTFMVEEELNELVVRINKNYVLPPPPDVPDELQIKLGFRRTVKFDWRGIHTVVRGEPHEYLWSDVERLHITRVEPLRRDFWKLELNLPDELMELRHQGSSQTWRGAGGEQLNELLLDRVPPERVDIDIAGRRPAKAVDIHRKLAALHKSRRELRTMVWILSPVCLAVIVGLMLAGGPAHAMLLLAFCIVHSPVVWMVAKRHRERTEQMERWLAEAEADSAGQPI